MNSLGFDKSLGREQLIGSESGLSTSVSKFHESSSFSDGSSSSKSPLAGDSNLNSWLGEVIARGVSTTDSSELSEGLNSSATSSSLASLNSDDLSLLTDHLLLAHDRLRESFLPLQSF